MEDDAPGTTPDEEEGPPSGAVALIAWTKTHSDEGQTWANDFLEEHKEHFASTSANGSTAATRSPPERSWAARSRSASSSSSCH